MILKGLSRKHLWFSFVFMMFCCFHSPVHLVWGQDVATEASTGGAGNPTAEATPATADANHPTNESNTNQSSSDVDTTVEEAPALEAPPQSPVEPRLDCSQAGITQFRALSAASREANGIIGQITSARSMELLKKSLKKFIEAGGRGVCSSEFPTESQKRRAGYLKCQAHYKLTRTVSDVPEGAQFSGASCKVDAGYKRSHRAAADYVLPNRIKTIEVGDPVASGTGTRTFKLCRRGLFNVDTRQGYSGQCVSANITCPHTERRFPELRALSGSGSLYRESQTYFLTNNINTELPISDTSFDAVCRDMQNETRGADVSWPAGTDRAFPAFTEPTMTVSREAMRQALSSGSSAGDDSADEPDPSSDTVDPNHLVPPSPGTPGANGVVRAPNEAFESVTTGSPEDKQAQQRTLSNFEDKLNQCGNRPEFSDLGPTSRGPMHIDYCYGTAGHERGRVSDLDVTFKVPFDRRQENKFKDLVRCLEEGSPSQLRTDETRVCRDPSHRGPCYNHACVSITRTQEGPSGGSAPSGPVRVRYELRDRPVPRGEVRPSSQR